MLKCCPRIRTGTGGQFHGNTPLQLSGQIIDQSAVGSFIQLFTKHPFGTCNSQSCNLRAQCFAGTIGFLFYFCFCCQLQASPFFTSLFFSFVNNLGCPLVRLIYNFLSLSPGFTQLNTGFLMYDCKTSDGLYPEPLTAPTSAKFEVQELFWADLSELNADEWRFPEQLDEIRVYVNDIETDN